MGCDVERFSETRSGQTRTETGYPISGLLGVVVRAGPRREAHVGDGGYALPRRAETRCLRSEPAWSGASEPSPTEGVVQSITWRDEMRTLSIALVGLIWLVTSASAQVWRRLLTCLCGSTSGTA